MGPNSHLIPVEINEESQDFFEALGISSERRDELMVHALISYNTENNLVSSLGKAADMSKVSHANELVAITYIVCKHHITLSNPAALLGMLGKGNSED